MTDNLGPLVAALAKAQRDFPTITRDKTVTVATKTGGSYSFKYAPLDSILAAVRGPLSDNGLALVQQLDDGALVTTLLHESGAALGGRIDLPQTQDIQALGSAITYLRRYAIQAVLGIAAEEDDDGNHAAGNTVKTRKPKDEPDAKATEPTYVDIGEREFTGIIAKGEGQFNDAQFHQGPNGHRFGFRLNIAGSKSAIHEAIVAGPVGEALYLAADVPLIGMEVSVAGLAQKIEQAGRTPRSRLLVSRIKGPTFEIPAATPPDVTPVAVSESEKVNDLDNLPW